MSDNNRVFISCVSDEFQKETAAFPGFRARLRDYLSAAYCEVRSQEVLGQRGNADTVQKLADDIAQCAAVIHLVGALPGALAHPRAVAAFRAAEPDFLKDHPELREALGDCADLTYTQWEAILALHAGVPLFVYRTPAGESAQGTHLRRLRLARKYPGDRAIVDPEHLVGQLIGDLRSIVPATPPAQRIADSRIVYRHPAEHFLGREAELAWLDQAWADGTNALEVVAWGGVGKTALLIQWLQTRFIGRDWRDAQGAPLLDAYFDWSFYDQGTGTLGTGDRGAVRVGNLGAFFEQALGFFGDPEPHRPGQGARLAGLVQAQRTLFVLDGLEPLQHPPGSPQAGHLLDPELAAFIRTLAQRNPGLLVVTSREHLRDFVGASARHSRRELEDLTRDTAVALLRQLQIEGTDAELAAACERFGCHALSLALVGRFLVRFHRKDIRRIDCIRDLHQADAETRDQRQRTAWRVLETYESWLARAQGADDSRELALLRLSGLFDRPAGADLLAALCAPPAIPGLTESLVGLGDIPWRGLLARLAEARLIRLRPSPTGATGSTGSTPTRWCANISPSNCGCICPRPSPPPMPGSSSTCAPLRPTGRTTWRACNRSIRPSATAVSPGGSRRLATRSTSSASCAVPGPTASTAGTNSARSAPTWARWRPSSTRPGCASRPTSPSLTSPSPTGLGC